MLTPPFFFPNTQITFVFCEGRIPSPIPKGLILMRPNVVLLAFTRFDEAYSLAFRDQPFGYLETSFFLPVRRRFAFGLFPTHIFPSTELPVRLGKEYYGFPKQQATHQATENSLTLLAEGGELTIEHGAYSHPISEATLLGTMGAWYGVPRPLTIPAFQLGVGLLSLLGLTLPRNIGVYNPTPSNGLNYAYFNVMHWTRIQQLDAPRLTATGAFFNEMGLVVKKAYHTSLSLFLSEPKSLRKWL